MLERWAQIWQVLGDNPQSFDLPGRSQRCQVYISLSSPFDSPVPPKMPPPKMPPYPYRLGPKNTTFMTTIRRPWAVFIFLLGLSFFVHLQMIRHAAKHQKTEECHREPMRSPIDNFQNL